MKNTKKWFPRPGDMCIGVGTGAAWMAISVDDRTLDDIVSVTWMRIWGDPEHFDAFLVQPLSVQDWTEELESPEWSWQLA